MKPNLTVSEILEQHERDCVGATVLGDRTRDFLDKRKAEAERQINELILEELESVFVDIDGVLWYAHPRMATGNVANEIPLADRIAHLKETEEAMPEKHMPIDSLNTIYDQGYNAAIKDFKERLGIK